PPPPAAAEEAITQSQYHHLIAQFQQQQQDIARLGKQVAELTEQNRRKDQIISELTESDRQKGRVISELTESDRQKDQLISELSNKLSDIQAIIQEHVKEVRGLDQRTIALNDARRMTKEKAADAASKSFLVSLLRILRVLQKPLQTTANPPPPYVLYNRDPPPPYVG
ncbi:hypothetical protein HK102_008597, partial [Quaeritorhiza haematococci]